MGGYRKEGKGVVWGTVDIEGGSGGHDGWGLGRGVMERLDRGRE